MANIVILDSVLDRPADKEQLKDGGHLEKAHDHIEIVCNDSSL